jgi:nucleoside-diphosphate kinase
MLERTFVMLKPDTVKRCVVGEILSRFERIGLKIVGMKFFHADRNYAKKHYANILDKPFYPSIEEYIVSGPVVAIILEGYHAIDVVRKMVGATFPSDAPPGTIRGDYAHMSKERGNKKSHGIVNLIHASDSPETAEKEIRLWFSESEIYDNYKTVNEDFM